MCSFFFERLEWECLTFHFEFEKVTHPFALAQIQIFFPPKILSEDSRDQSRNFQTSSTGA